MTNDKIKKKIIDMIKDITAVDTLEEGRAECLFSLHLFDKHIAKDLNLTPKQMADIAFTLGRSCQLGVLYGLLWHTNEITDEVEIKAKKLYEKALKDGVASWRED